jgi:DNA-binding XRE family transcriptional regulator
VRIGLKKQTIGWIEFVQDTFRYLAFVKTAMNFSVFHKTPPEEASEPDLGLCYKLFNYFPDTIDEHHLTQIYKKSDPNYFRSSLGETEEKHDIPIMPSFYELGVKTD